jgi:hypothetical protein
MNVANFKTHLAIIVGSAGEHPSDVGEDDGVLPSGSNLFHELVCRLRAAFGLVLMVE